MLWRIVLTVFSLAMIGISSCETSGDDDTSDHPMSNTETPNPTPAATPTPSPNHTYLPSGSYILTDPAAYILEGSTVESTFSAFVVVDDSSIIGVAWLHLDDVCSMGYDLIGYPESRPVCVTCEVDDEPCQECLDGWSVEMAPVDDCPGYEHEMSVWSGMLASQWWSYNEWMYTAGFCKETTQPLVRQYDVRIEQEASK